MTIGPPLGRGFDERVPLVLVIDTSDSMARPADSPRIAELNSALSGWLSDARSRPSLRNRLEVAIITFSSTVQVLDPATGNYGSSTAETAFAPIGQVADPGLVAGGYTLMLPAVDLALDLATARRRLLAEQGLPCRRPRIWLLTDGAASTASGELVGPEELAKTARLLRAAENPNDQNDGCLFYAIGVGNADRAALEILAPDSTIMLDRVNFREILGLVSYSTEVASSGDTSDEAYRQSRDMADLLDQFRAFEQRFKDQ